MSCSLHGSVWCTCPDRRPDISPVSREEFLRLVSRNALLDARVERLEKLIEETHHAYLLKKQESKG